MTARFGLGMAAIGRPGYMTLNHRNDVVDASEPGMRRHAGTMLDAAWAAGIRHLDTARSYGHAESFLASWLETRKPTGAFVSSKWGYRYTAAWQRDARLHEVKDHSLQHFEAQLHETRTTLGSALNLYQIHSVTLESGVLDDAPLIDALARLRDSGVEVGFSATGAQQPAIIRRAMQVTRGGSRVFDWVQATWNLLEPSAAAALNEAKQAGLKIIVKEPLANGKLTARGAFRELNEAAASLQTTPDALALAAALAQPWADTVLIGAATVEQLTSNLKAQSLKVDATAFSHWALAAEQYWQQRKSLEWT